MNAEAAINKLSDKGGRGGNGYAVGALQLWRIYDRQFTGAHQFIVRLARSGAYNRLFTPLVSK
jgi:hypothetical protein